MEQDYYIETTSVAPGSAVQTYYHRDVRDARAVAREFAQRRANASNAQSDATVYVGSERKPRASASARPVAV